MTSAPNDSPPRGSATDPSLTTQDAISPGTGSRQLPDGSQLAQLSTAGAFWLFAIALVVGALAVGVEEGVAWQSPLAIVWYSGVLLVAQRRYRVPLNGGVQDSPYFLGFILTLFGLVKIFTTIAATNVGGLDIGVVVGQAGAALVATAVGLMARQALTSFDPGEEARDQMFRTTTSGIREQAAELHALQSEFIAAARSHARLRTAHFDREKRVAAEYLQTLESATVALKVSAEGYPAKVGQVLASLASHIEELEKAGGKAEQLFEDLRTSAAKVFEHEVSSFTRALTTTADKLKEARQSSVSEADLVTAALSGAVTGLKVRAAELDEAAARYPATAQGLIGALTGVGNSLETVTGKLNELVTSFESARKQLDETNKELSEETNGRKDGVQARADALKQEINAIDGVISELVGVLTKRLKVAEREGLRL